MVRMPQESWSDKQNAIVQQIAQAEKLRAEAVQEDGKFNDQKYQQALTISQNALDAMAPLLSQEDKPSPELAAAAHLHIMIATIEQSRAKHTLEQPEDKKRALARAQKHLSPLEKLAEELSRRGYYQTADGTPFLWLVEVARAQARNQARQPDAGRQELEQALENYQKARNLAEQMSRKESLDIKIRNAALMATGTARVEAALIQQQLRMLNAEQAKQEFSRALGELTQAWDNGYQNTDRLRASCGRMVKLIREEYPDLADLAAEIKRAFKNKTGKELK